MLETLSGDSVKTIAHLIELSIAPVFMLAGIAGFLNVFTGRLARIIDRLEKINQFQEANKREKLPPRLVIRQKSLMKRMKNTNRAILLMSATGLLIAFVMVTMFLSAIFKFHDSTFISILFISAMSTFILSLLLFCKEILDTVSSAEIRSRYLP